VARQPGYSDFRRRSSHVDRENPETSAPPIHSGTTSASPNDGRWNSFKTRMPISVITEDIKNMHANPIIMEDREAIPFNLFNYLIIN
jgi:hypothetical protein